MKESVARCHLLARILAADGIMADKERVMLQAKMNRLGLSDEERAQVIHFEGAKGAEACIRALPEEARQAMISEFLSAAFIDGNLSPLEVAEIKKIARAIGIEDV